MAEKSINLSTLKSKVAVESQRPVYVSDKADHLVSITVDGRPIELKKLLTKFMDGRMDHNTIDEV